MQVRQYHNPEYQFTGPSLLESPALPQHNLRTSLNSAKGVHSHKEGIVSIWQNTVLGSGEGLGSAQWLIIHSKQPHNMCFDILVLPVPCLQGAQGWGWGGGGDVRGGGHCSLLPSTLSLSLPFSHTVPTSLESPSSIPEAPHPQGCLCPTMHYGGHLQGNAALPSPRDTHYFQPHLGAPLNLLFNMIHPFQRSAKVTYRVF